MPRKITTTHTSTQFKYYLFYFIQIWKFSITANVWSMELHVCIMFVWLSCSHVQTESNGTNVQRSTQCTPSGTDLPLLCVKELSVEEFFVSCGFNVWVFFRYVFVLFFLLSLVLSTLFAYKTPNISSSNGYKLLCSTFFIRSSCFGGFYVCAVG